MGVRRGVARQLRPRLSRSLSSADQFQISFEPDAALARKRRALEQTALGIARPGKTNSNLVSAEYRVFPSRRRMLLIDHLPSPSTAGGGI